MSNKDPFAEIEPAALWKNFSDITNIPRPSGQEGPITDWLIDWANIQGFSFRRDSAGNICIYVPASPDRLTSPAIALQAHLDMVCVSIDGSLDNPRLWNIKIIRDGDWIVAPNSTLGADNGIGIAAAMALAESEKISHGPLELLFTVDEETTFKGADELDPSLISSRLMLNLDSEDSSEVTIGCAGGIVSVIRWPAPDKMIPGDWIVREISITGLCGGHSGGEIHKNLLNGIKGMVWLLRCVGEDLQFKLCAVSGGDADNAIPISAQGTIALPAADLKILKEIIDTAVVDLKNRFSYTDPELSVTITSVDPEGKKCWNDEGTNRLLNLLAVIPSGVIAMEQHDGSLVKTSNNLGKVLMNDRDLEIRCLTRSSAAAAQEDVAASIESTAQLAGADFRIELPITPPWPPISNSALLALVQKTYRDLFQREIEVATTHGGLECGAIREHIPGLDVVSIGPDIQQAHKPGERVNIPSVGEFYKLLCEIIRRIGDK